MGKNILITPGDALINFSGTSAGNINQIVQDDGRVSFIGVSSGAEQLTISDSLSGSVFTVNNSLGSPIIDIDFDNTITVPIGASDGYVWTSDSGGTATWQASPGLSNIFVNKTTYVDALNGNDSTGVRGDMGLPYLTISGANQTAITGDTVHVRPGIYQECDILTDGIAYYFDNGSIVHPTDAQQTIIGTAILDASGYTYPIVILGYGEFISDFSDNIGGQEGGVGNFNTDSVHCQFLKATWTNGNSQGGPKGVFWLFHTGPDDTSIRIIGGTITKNNDTGGASNNCIYVYGGKNIFIDATLINTNTTGGGSAIYLNAGIDTTLIGHGDIFVSASTATCYGIRHSNNTNYLSWDGKIEIGEQLNGYAIYLETSGGGEFRYSGYFLGAIYLSAGGLNNKGVYLNGIQQCTGSPNNYAITATNDGNYVIDLNITSSVTGIFWMKDDGVGSIPSVIFQGAIAPSAFSSRLMTVETGKFVWNGIIEDTNKRFENSVITGGEVVVQSDLDHWGSNSPGNEYIFFVNGGTLRVEGCKIENHQLATGCGVIEMTNNVNNTLILNGATLIAEQNDPIAYSVKTPSADPLDVQIYGDSYSNRHIGPGTLHNIVPNGGFLYNLTACTTVYKYCDLNISGKTTTTNFQMTSGATDGYILTSDAVGDASWQAVDGSSSGSCIDTLWVSTISGCSPVTIGNSINLEGAKGTPGFINAQPSGGMICGDISTSYGGHGFKESRAPRIINKNGDESMTLCIDHPYDLTLDYKNNGFVDEILRIGVTTSAGTTGLTSSFGTGIPVGVIINSDTSKIASGITRSVVIGGSNITATTSDTVYVPNLNIGTVGGGTSITNIGIDSAGNVTSGITEHNDFFIKRTLIKSELLALTGTPIELISAPGPGKIILPHQIHVLYKFSGTGYTADGGFNTMQIGQSGLTWMSVYNSNFEKLEDWLITDSLNAASAAPVYNHPLIVSSTGDGLTDPDGMANGTIQIDVHYGIMDSN